jgi:hypothetical protein
MMAKADDSSDIDSDLNNRVEMDESVSMKIITDEISEIKNMIE